MKCTNYCFKPLGLLFLLCLIPLWAFSQNITVKGVVKDATGESVIGASVVQKGTSNGIITDIDGNFTLNVPSNSTIVISFVGYKTQEIPVAGKTQINVTMKEDTEMLDEVVVVAYATDENTDTDTSDTILENAEEMPKYPGGTEGLMRYLAKNIKYPVDAQKSKTQGRVVVQIIIDKEGRVTSPKIVQSVSPSLDAEAIRVITGMPRWEPGKNKGETLAVQYTLPINFKLQ